MVRSDKTLDFECSEKQHSRSSPSKVSKNTSNMKDQQEFWASLQSQHERKKTEMEQEELEWDYEDVSSPSSPLSGSWTFNDFMEQYNSLYAALNQIQELVFNSVSSKVLAKALSQHLEEIREQYENFVDRSSYMAIEFLDLREEILCRVELLSAKWEILMTRTSSSNLRMNETNDSDNMHADIEQDVRGLRKWLKEMEGKILPLQFKAQWSQEAIDEKMKEIQVILSDIESHGQVVKSVLRICEDLKRGRDDIFRKQSHQPYYDVERACKVSKGLEDRWHCVWLRCLEWQCFLEQLAWSEENTSEPFTSDHHSNTHLLLNRVEGHESEDEPLCKIRKITNSLIFLPSPSCTLLRTKKRKTAKCKEFSNFEAQRSKENQDDKNEEEKSSSSWTRLVVAASLTENHRKTLKINRDKRMKKSEDYETFCELGQTIGQRSNVEKKDNERGEITSMTNSQNDFIRQSFPNCATYFFQHVSEDEDKRKEIEEYEFENLLMSSESNSDVLDYNEIHGDIEDDEDDPMEISGRTDSLFLTHDLKELVQRAEKMVRDDEVPICQNQRRRRRRRRRRRKSFVQKAVGMHDGCEASAEASSSELSECSDELYSSSSSSFSSQNCTLASSSSTLNARLISKSASRRLNLSFSESHLARISQSYSLPKSKSYHSLHSSSSKKSPIQNVCISSNEEEWTLESKLPEKIENSLTSETKALPMEKSPRSLESGEEDFWDQEKYLSEHNYDEAIDEDTALQILNFGDDYRNFIDSMSDGVSSGTQHLKQPRRKLRRNLQMRNGMRDSMSESEVEDVRRVLNDCKNRLEVAENQFAFYLQASLNHVTLNDYINLKKTCQENMSCLTLLMEPIFKESDSATLKKTGRELKSLLQKWEALLRNIMKRIGLSEIYEDLESKIRSLEVFLDSCNESLTPPNKRKKIQGSNELKDKIAACKGVIVRLTGYKSNLFTINLGVHNFLAELSSFSSFYDGSEEAHREFKDRVLELYGKWDGTFHSLSGRLAEHETDFAKLKLLEDESQKLLQDIVNRKQRTKENSHEDDFDSGISGESSTDSEIAQRERLVAKLRVLALELEQTLCPQSKILQDISENLNESTLELQNLKRSSSSYSSLKGSNVIKDSSSSSSWKSRVFKIAFPMQMGCFLIFLLSWLLEPMCCDSSNNYLLTPQLRYVNGPPPI